MKKAAILFLIGIILLQCGIKVAIMAYYQINKNYIAANFCENKTKPAMHCEGKCYLAKKIKAQQEEQNKINSILKAAENTLFCQASISFAIEKVAYFISNEPNYCYSLPAYISSLGSIFQPPRQG